MFVRALEFWILISLPIHVFCFQWDEEDEDVRYSIVNKGTVNLFLTAHSSKNLKELGDVTTETREVAHFNISHWKLNEIQEDGKKLYILTSMENQNNKVTRRMNSNGEFLENRYKFIKYSDARGYFIELAQGNEAQPTCMMSTGRGNPVTFRNCCYACKNDKSAFYWKFHPYPFDWKAPRNEYKDPSIGV